MRRRTGNYTIPCRTPQIRDGARYFILFKLLVSEVRKVVSVYFGAAIDGTIRSALYFGFREDNTNCGRHSMSVLKLKHDTGQ